MKNKKYQIIKLKNGYAITTKEAIKDYYTMNFLPYEKKMKFKKYLIKAINTSETFTKYKNNTDFKTVYIC